MCSLFSTVFIFAKFWKCTTQHPRLQPLLILSSWRSLSHRNQSIDLQSKSIDCFLYDGDLRHERIKITGWIFTEMHSGASQTSKMKLFAKLVNSLQPLTIFGKNSVLMKETLFDYSHQKRKDSLDTRAVFSWILILTWNFGGGRSGSAQP